MGNVINYPLLSRNHLLYSSPSEDLGLAWSCTSDRTLAALSESHWSSLPLWRLGRSRWCPTWPLSPPLQKRNLSYEIHHLIRPDTIHLSIILSPTQTSFNLLTNDFFSYKTHALNTQTQKCTLTVNLELIYKIFYNGQSTQTSEYIIHIPQCLGYLTGL